MKIELQVVSPEVKLSGFDAALAKLDAMEQTLHRLSQFKKIGFTVSVSAPGLNKLRTDLSGLQANTKNLAQALRDAGQTSLGNMVEKDLVSAGEAMRFARAEAAKLTRELEIAERQGALITAKFGEVKGRTIVSPDNLRDLEKYNTFLDKNQKERAQIQQRIGSLQSASGMASAMVGGEKIAETAEAEARLAAAQPGAIAGMKEQAEIAALKARQMAGLKKQVDAVEASEKKLDASTSTNADSLTKTNAQAKMLSQTYRRVKDGADELVKTRTRGASGEVITTDVKKGWVTREITAMDQVKQAVAEAEREGTEAIARATTDWERLIAVEKKARDIRSALSRTDLQDEPYVKQKLAAAAALDMRAEDMAKSQAMKAQREGEIQQLDRYRQMAHDIRTQSREDRGIGSGGTKAESYRNEAQALDQLRGSMGLTNQEAVAFARQLEMQSTMLRSQANEIDRVAQDRAVMARDRIREFDDLQRRWGATPNTKSTATASGRRDSTVVDREVNGMRETARLTAEYDHHGRALNATLTTTASRIEAVEKTTRGYGRTLLNGIGSFAGFVAASSAVYGAVSLIGHGFDSFASMERQSAVLRTVFNGTAEEADLLRDRVLGLAAAYGRGSNEAIDAATRWARIGLSAAQTAEAVAVSLEAANVAEISAAEAAEQLSAIYAAFGLTIGQVRVALNQMNTVSNTVNVTVKDLLGGMQRVSGLAHQAGLSVAETIGIIGSAVSRTGRSGGEIGNAMKAMISAVSNPALQEFMKSGFGMDVKTDAGDIKDFSTVLNELFITYQKLTDAERQELLVKLGGKQQASRFAAILDGYVKSQKLAIEAQLDMNSADRENQNIRATLMSQLTTMSTMFEKLSLDMANAGGSFSINSTLTEFVKLLGHAMSVLDKLPGVTIAVTALFLTMAGRMLISAAAMQDGAVKANYLTSTLTQLKGAYGAMAAAVDQANARLVIQDGLLGRIAARSLGVSGRAAAMRGGVANGLMSQEAGAMAMSGAVSQASGIGKGVAFIIGAIPALLRFAAGFALITVAMWGINKAFEYFQGDAEKARRKLAGFNEELERLRANSNAADRRQRLAATLQTSIGSIAMRSPEAARDALANFADAAAPGSPGRAAAIRDELQGLLAQNKISELEVRLGQMRLGIQKEHETAKLRELALGKEAQAALRSELAAERTRVNTSTGTEREEAAKRVAELENRIAEELGRQAQTQQDLVELETERAEETESAKSKKEAIKNRLETTEKIAEAMPNLDSSTAHWKREQQANEINIAQTKERISLFGEQRAAAQKAAEQAVTGLKREVAVLEAIAVKRQQGIDKGTTPMEVASPGEFVKGGGLWGGKDFVGNAKRVMEERREGLRLLRQAQDAAVTRNMPDDAWAEYTQSRMREDDLRSRGAHWQVSREMENQRGIVAMAGGQGAKEAQAEYEARRKILDVAEQQAAAAAIQNEEQIKLEEEALKELEAKKKILDQERDRVRILDEIKAGAEEAKGIGLRNQIGRNEGEKLVNEFNALRPFDTGSDIVAQNRAGNVLSGATAEPFKDQAQMMGQVQRMEEVLNSAVERRNRLMAETVNLRRQEAEEASKALQTASREEQLRAAGLARFNKERGRGFTSSEFQFLDKSTQEAITKFTPDAAPRELRPASEKAAEEARLLDANINGMKDILDRTKQVLDKFLVPAQAPNSIPDGRPPAPAVNNININLGDQFDGLVAKMTQVVQQDVARISQRVDAFLAANSVATAQSASQLAG